MINPKKYVIKHIVNIHKSFFMKDYVAMVEEVQTDAYNQAIDDAARSLIQTENQWGSEYLDQKQKILNLKVKTDEIKSTSD